VLGLPVDWRSPAAVAQAVTAYIRLFPRTTLPTFIGTMFQNRLHGRYLPHWIVPTPGFKPQGLGWVCPWALAQVVAFPTETVIPVVLGIAALGLRLWRRRRAETAEPTGYAWLAILVALGGLIFWIATSPEPRYGMPVCWAFGATCIAIVPPAIRRAGRPVRPAIVWLAIVLCIIPMVHRMVGIRTVARHQPFTSVPIMFPGPDHGFHPVPIWPMHPVVARDGLVINVPDTNILIYYAPLPAASTPLPDVTWRQPGDLGGGFRTVQP
jgi:hypothetical protein